MRTTLIRLVVLLFAAFPAYLIAKESSGPTITHIAGGLYVVNVYLQASYNSVFLTTDEGIIVADPVNTELAAWVKAELDKRFKMPVKYVIYSHSDADHVTGGEVFAGTAKFVAQRKAAPVIEKEGHAPVPTVLFDERMDLTLGGKTIELSYFGPSHTDNLIVMYFPDEDAMFAPDLAYVRRMPWKTLPRYYYPGIINALHALDKMDFSIAIPGHGEVGIKMDFTDHMHYLEKLAAAVKKARTDGLTLGEMQSTIKFDEYSNWGYYHEFMPLNVEGMNQIIEESEKSR